MASRRIDPPLLLTSEARTSINRDRWRRLSNKLRGKPVRNNSLSTRLHNINILISMAMPFNDKHLADAIWFANKRKVRYDVQSSSAPDIVPTNLCSGKVALHLSRETID
jgi:hypothetical protein